LEHVLWSRKTYAEALGITTERMWFPRQVHGTDIIVLSKSSENNNLNKDITQKYEEETTAYYDAVLTDEKRLLIGVSTADCVPILLYDPIKEVVGAVHAGWRGTVARIATKSIMKLSEVFGCNPLDIKAMIGPSISPEAFEVGDEVAVQFAENGFADCIVNGYEKPHIDLWKTNRKQLIQSGLLVENIDCTPICTYHNSDILFSARKLGIKSGRIISAIMLL
ncbi:MAG: peptidoglycan editing factor PgeF, partial [Bacteroidales bacterium]|nr:peptidoglycan editing factor PgeF [Bacteroidales bacterium]